MSTLTRRRFLGRLGAASLIPAGILAAAAARPPERPAAPAPTDTPAPPRRRLDALVRLLRETPRESVLERAVERLDDGLTHRDLLGATFLAGVHDIRPRPVGFKIHAVMMVPSALLLAEGASPDERLLPVLFNVDDFKRSQTRDRWGGDWTLPPAPTAPSGGAEDAGRGLVDALERWDEDAADRAAVAAHARLALEEAFEILWLYGARDFSNIGHKIIFTAAVYRVLRMIGWEYGQPALRSLVYGLLYGSAGETTADFERNRKDAPRLGAPTDGGRADPRASAALLERLRTATSAQAARRVLELLDQGVAPESIWDGLRLAGSELLLRAPGILAVHPVTSLNAFHFAYRATGRDATRGLMLLQAASWIPLFRDELDQRTGDTESGPRIDTVALTAGEPPAAIEAARRLVFRKADETHAYKLSAAVFEEHGFAHAEWSARLLVAARAYLPTSRAPDAEIYSRMRRALERLRAPTA